MAISIRIDSMGPTDRVLVQLFKNPLGAMFEVITTKEQMLLEPVREYVPKNKNSDAQSFYGLVLSNLLYENDGRHFLSNTTVAPAVGTVEQTEQSNECCNKGPAKKQKKFATKSEELQYWQVQYFKGEVEKQEREKQLLDIRIRMLLKEEMRRDQKVVDEIINGKFVEN